jgi:hypothetical protein
MSKRQRELLIVILQMPKEQKIFKLLCFTAIPVNKTHHLQNMNYHSELNKNIDVKPVLKPR